MRKTIRVMAAATLCAGAILAGCAGGQLDARSEAGSSSGEFVQVAETELSSPGESSDLASTKASVGSSGASASSATPAGSETSSSAKQAEDRTASLSDCAIAYDDASDLGGAFLDISVDDFAALGFKLGDGVDVSFSNGATFENVPFYNGNYAVVGELQLVSYPDAATPKLCVNHGDDLWSSAGLSPDDTVSITLRVPGAYADVQDAFDMDYTVNREDYPTDVVFANYRALSGGNLKEGAIFRSASPIDNEYNRAPYANALMAGDGVNFVVDLPDNDDAIQGYLWDNEANGVDDGYFQGLYEGGGVTALGLTADYKTDEFASALASGFNQMAQHDGPYLVHCVVGRDRTGFACALIEALAGASYDEIARDYMASYENYYGVTAERDLEKYDTIRRQNLDPMLRHIAGVDADADLAAIDLVEAARLYLQSAGMTDVDLDAFLSVIC